MEVTIEEVIHLMPIFLRNQQEVGNVTDSLSRPRVQIKEDEDEKQSTQNLGPCNFRGESIVVLYYRAETGGLLRSIFFINGAFVFRDPPRIRGFNLSCRHAQWRIISDSFSAEMIALPQSGVRELHADVPVGVPMAGWPSFPNFWDSSPALGNMRGTYALGNAPSKICC
ncbi:hypothetical protein U1Q18_032256 [Sarracenia purpurea var. burkii]